MVSVLLAIKLLRKKIEIINTKFTPSVVNKKVSKSLDGLDWIGFFVFISIIL